MTHSTLYVEILLKIHHIKGRHPVNGQTSNLLTVCSHQLISPQTFNWRCHQSVATVLQEMYNSGPNCVLLTYNNIYTTYYLLIQLLYNFSILLGACKYGIHQIFTYIPAGMELPEPLTAPNPTANSKIAM